MGWWTVILKEFSILSFHIFCCFLWLNCCISLPSPYLDPQKPMMRGSPGPPSGMRGGPGPNFANINNIHQVDKQTNKQKKAKTTEQHPTVRDPHEATQEEELPAGVLSSLITILTSSSSSSSPPSASPLSSSPSS